MRGMKRETAWSRDDTGIARATLRCRRADYAVLRAKNDALNSAPEYGRSDAMSVTTTTIGEEPTSVIGAKSRNGSQAGFGCMRGSNQSVPL
jgi:hypothetical protein